VQSYLISSRSGLDFSAIMRILLVDDHPLMCAGLKLVLEREVGLTVVGQALDGATALSNSRELSPDLIIMDVELGTADGIALAGKILRELPSAKVIAVSELANLDSLDRAMRAGIRGYLIKGNSECELIRAIRAVERHGFYVCEEAMHMVVANCRELRASSSAPERSLLTDRELQVLKLTAAGLRVKDIANQLNIGIKTVDTHRSKLLAKLGCSSVAELTRYAARRGIVAF